MRPSIPERCAGFLAPFLAFANLCCERDHPRADATALAAEATCRTPAPGTRLSRIGLEVLDTELEPWLHLEAEQERYYIGPSPRELVLGFAPQDRPSLPEELRPLAEKGLLGLAKALKLPVVEFELWPAFDEWGLPTWMIARHRATDATPWNWLDWDLHGAEAPAGPGDPTVVSLPVLLDPALPEHHRRIFDTEGEDLYHLPEFGSVLWASKDQDELIAAWLPPTKRERCAQFLGRSRHVAILVAPPARFNGKPFAFHASVSNRGVIWKEPVQWVRKSALPAADEPEKSIIAWPDDFTERFAADVLAFSGEAEIFSPLSGKRIDFDRLGSGQSDNQLLDLVAYLKAGYERLGYASAGRFEMEEQRFEWRSIPQSNLVLRVVGSLPAGRNRPVVLSGHIDKAIAEDTFEATGRRLTTPGADDNVTALAALRLAAQVFVERYRHRPPPHDIWIVHFTGEEYPASCLGSRHFTSDLLRRRQDVGLAINLDMLGDRTAGDRVFQISPGNQPGSFRAAAVALAAALAQGGGWRPTLRHPLERDSYITQTDAAVLDWAGYPTILFNEHISLERQSNERYHQSGDRAGALDIGYATAQAKAAIETTVRCGERR